MEEISYPQASPAVLPTPRIAWNSVMAVVLSTALLAIGIAGLMIAAVMMLPKLAAGSAIIRRFRTWCWFHTRCGRTRPGKSPGKR